MKNVKVMQADLKEALLNVNMMVYNPNSHEIVLDEIQYKIKLNGRHFSEGVARENLKVGAKTTTLIPLPLKVKYSDLLLSLDDIAKGKQLTYDVVGDAKLGLFAIPFSKSGNLDL
ncbi:MAG: LEA type 2 family protein [Bdellovibrionales bacterium]